MGTSARTHAAGGAAKARGARRWGSMRLFSGSDRSLEPEDIVPGLYFRQRDETVWEVVRMVTFQVHPLPHVELVRARGGSNDSLPGRKIISVSALLDRSLYVLESALPAAAE
jgi:hypothetical protein